MFSRLLEPSEHIFSWDVLSWLLKAWKHDCHVPLLINSLYCHLGPSVTSWIRIRIQIRGDWIRIRIRIQENRGGFRFVWIRILGVWIRIQIRIRDVRIRTSLFGITAEWLWYWDILPLTVTSALPMGFLPVDPEWGGRPTVRDLVSLILPP